VKIQRFVLANVFLSFLVITILSAGFYYIERNVTLKYVAIGLNQNVFNLEEDLIKALQAGQDDVVQTLLDQAAAINVSVKTFSLSKDGETISASSSRSMQGKPITEGYLPILNLFKGVLDEQLLHYSAELTYFSGNQKQHALLLVDLNRDFVYGRLNQIALLYGTILFLIFATLALIAYFVVRRWIIDPMERIAMHARNQGTEPQQYLVEELTFLDETLSNSFKSMKTQQDHLQEALDETRYLDGILRTVADINQYLLTAKDVSGLLQDSCKRLAEHPGYALCHIALKKEDHLMIEAYSNDTSGYLSVGMEIPLDIKEAEALNPTVRAFNVNETVIIDHLERMITPQIWHHIAEKGRFGAVIALPLLESVDALPIGVMTLYTTRSFGFEPKEIAMLEELAGDIGFAVASFTRRQQLQYYLTTDSNTGLLNRFSLLEALEKEKNFALAIINIDRFSDINDVYGVAMGDAILAEYGRWLEIKVAPEKNSILYKMGSDEYALVYSQCNDMSKCLGFLEMLVDQTQKETFVVEGIEIVLTITIGVAPMSDRVLEHATAALKEAKRNRRSIEVFSASFKREQENNIAWYKRIKEAIETSRIVPYFQPIVDNATQKIIKYEALVRMVYPDGTVISPYQFLGIAKKTKLYPELTRVMVEKTIAVFTGSDIPVSLNLSTQDMTNDELADYLEASIRANGMGRQIIFEILESEGIENYEAVSSFVERFKAIGCRFAIDDFGSGYSNFEHLLRLNIDTIKIDATLIKNLPHDRNAQIFVKHIADFAREMGISTIAEFVSCEEVYHRVKAIGIDASQGYYFYEPSPELIRETNA